jgi:hypothetical protein
LGSLKWTSNLIDQATADKIIATPRDMRWGRVYVPTNNGGAIPVVDHTRRKVWLGDANDQIIKDILDPYIRTVIEPAYQIMYTYGVTYDQIKYNVIYNEYSEGCFFEKHQDQPQAFTDLVPDYRVVSVIIGLGGEYTGGDLIVEDKSFHVGLGDVVMHAPNAPHEVTPVLSGCRYNLAMWLTIPNPYLKKKQ